MAAVQMPSPRIPPATVTAISDALRAGAPSLQGAPPASTSHAPAVTHAAARRTVSEDGLRVRRSKQLAAGEEELINKAVEERSLYVAPFPMNCTLDGASRGACALAHRAHTLTLGGQD